MRAPRRLIFFILTFSAFLSLACAEKEVVAGGGEAADDLKDVASFFEYLMGTEEEKQQRQQPMEAFFSILKRLLVSLTHTKEEAEELQANLTKALDLQRKREEIVKKMEQVAGTLEGVDAAEKKDMLRREMQDFMQQLRESVSDSLIFAVKAAGVKPSDAEKIVKGNTLLAQFFLQLELFLMSYLGMENSGLA